MKDISRCPILLTKQVQLSPQMRKSHRFFQYPLQNAHHNQLMVNSISWKFGLSDSQLFTATVLSSQHSILTFSTSSYKSNNLIFSYQPLIHSLINQFNVKLDYFTNTNDGENSYFFLNGKYFSAKGRLSKQNGDRRGSKLILVFFCFPILCKHTK